MPPQTILLYALSPKHASRLAASGIDPERIRERGYYTEQSGAGLGRLGFPRSQQQTPALVIPIWGPKGKTSLYQIRPDRPRISKGREVKYETPFGAKLLLDIPPSILSKVLDPGEPLLITEGVLKADAAATKGLACIACLGVDGWGGDTETWDAIPTQGRRVLVAFDSDVRVKKEVRAAAGRLAAFLKKRGAKVEFILLPDGDDGSKLGLDDYLASGKGVDELFALAAGELPAPPGDLDDDRGTATRYETTDDGIFKVIDGKNGETRTRLANFTATIVAELIYAENPDRPREFEIEVKLRGKVTTAVVTAGEFERMAWVMEHLGAEAIIEPGFGVRDEVRAAIQSNSGAVRQIIAYDRLGWADLRGDGSRWGFMHADGVIQADSPAENSPPDENRPAKTHDPGTSLRQDGPKRPISPATSAAAEVRVHHLSPTLSRYALPEPPGGEMLRNAIRISLGFLALAPDRIAFALYMGMWRVVIDVVRFSLFLVGPSGLGKTELTAALVQHFGPEMDAEHIPESFVSTANAVAAVAHQACHVVLPVDDLVPGGSAGKIQQVYAQAEHLMRSQGNRVGRNRCNRDGSTQGGRESRALYLCNGEDSPPGESLGARYFNLEVMPGDVLDLEPGETTKSARLRRYQELARQGYPAMAMAGFLRWLAPDLRRHRREMHEQKLTFRDEVFRGKAAHPRVVDIAADLLAGFDLFLFFALEVGAVGEDEHAELWGRAHEALFEVLKAQDRHHVEQDPARRLLGLLGGALTTGRAHLLNLAEDDPKHELGSPRLFGYAEKTIRVTANPAGSQASDPEAGGAPEDFEEKTILQPLGEQIGWRHCDNLYFEPERALGVAQRIAWEAGEPPIPLTRTGLGKRLNKHDLLASKEPDRNTARPLIDGKKTDVWHIRVDKFYEFLEPWEKHWSARRDEEALREHEDFLRRQEERERLAEIRMRKAAAFVQGEHCKLLDPGPAPDVCPPVGGEDPPPPQTPSVRGDDESPQQLRPAPVQDGEGPPLAPDREVEAEPGPEAREVAIRPRRDDEGSFLD